VAHALTKNYATLVSGVLIGLSEALQKEGMAKSAPRPAMAPAAAAAPARTAATAVAKTAAKKALDELER